MSMTYYVTLKTAEKQIERMAEPGYDPDPSIKAEPIQKAKQGRGGNGRSGGGRQGGQGRSAEGRGNSGGGDKRPPRPRQHKPRSGNSDSGSPWGNRGK